MRPEEFVARRQAQWGELEGAISTLRRGSFRSMRVEQMERIATLYRHAVSDLAIARRDFPNENVTEYLNSLCGRVQPLITRGTPMQPRQIPRLFTEVIPQRWRAAWGYWLVSVGVAVASTLLAYVATSDALRTNPDLAQQLIGRSLFGQELQGGVASSDVSGVQSSLYIIMNNLLATALIFIMGVTVGIGTTFYLANNFWMLGSLAAATHFLGEDYVFWSYIASHGVIELSIILVGGAAGYIVADSILRPGTLGRGESLVIGFRKAFVLGGGMALVLVVCGLIEGFVSPSTLDPAVKYGIGITTFVLLYSWLLLAGRRPRREQPASVALALPG